MSSGIEGRARCSCSISLTTVPPTRSRCGSASASTASAPSRKCSTVSPERSKPVPSLSEVKEFRTQMFERSMALIDKKGHDYNRTQQQAGDTLFNLTVCKVLGITDTSERGILVRLSDKFMRLISLTAQQGIEAANLDE